MCKMSDDIKSGNYDGALLGMIELAKTTSRDVNKIKMDVENLKELPFRVKAMEESLNKKPYPLPACSQNYKELESKIFALEEKLIDKVSSVDAKSKIDINGLIKNIIYVVAAGLILWALKG